MENFKYFTWELRMLIPKSILNMFTLIKNNSKYSTVLAAVLVLLLLNWIELL